MEHRLISLTLIGSVNLDLRKALLSGPEASVMALAVVGGVNACVPSGVRVDVGGLSLFGQRSVDVEAPAPGAPVIRIQAYAVAGGVRVTSPRGWH
jgi:predicted membrane protein